MTYYITPGLGMSLATPSTGQAFETTVVNNNFTLLENAILLDRTRIGLGIFTSATRPGAPVTGQIIVETDTRNTMYWNGIRWVPADAIPNASSAAARDALYPAPVAGNRIFRTDIGPYGDGQVYSAGAWVSTSNPAFIGAAAAPATSTSAQTYSTVTIPVLGYYLITGIVKFDISTSSAVRLTTQLVQPAVAVRDTTVTSPNTLAWAGQAVVSWTGLMNPGTVILTVATSAIGIGTQIITPQSLTALFLGNAT